MPDPLLPHGDLQLLVLDLVKDVAHYASLPTNPLLGCLHMQHRLYREKKRKDKTMPVSVNLMRSQVLYWAAQGLYRGVFRLLHQPAAHCLWPADELPKRTEQLQCQLKPIQSLPARKIHCASQTPLHTLGVGAQQLMHGLWRIALVCILAFAQVRSMLTWISTSSSSKACCSVQDRSLQLPPSSLLFSGAKQPSYQQSSSSAMTGSSEEGEEQ